VSLNADRWPDDVRLSDIEPRFICAACGRRAPMSRQMEPQRHGSGRTIPRAWRLNMRFLNEPDRPQDYLRHVSNRCAADRLV